MLLLTHLRGRVVKISFIKSGSAQNSHEWFFRHVGQSWAAASSEGLVVYSLEPDIVFDPFQLDCDITPDKIWQASSNKEHTKALVLGLRINELELVCQVMEAVQPCDSKFYKLLATSICLLLITQGDHHALMRVPSFE